MSGPVDVAGVATVWSAERVVQLRRHYAAGLSASDSAILLGGVSKNAVVSKRIRLGLVGIVRPAARAAETRLRREPVRVAKAAPAPRRLPLPKMDGAPPADAAPKPLAQHGRGECIWPLGPAEQAGDWRTLFCCAPAVLGRRYCAHHAGRARG